MVILPLISLGVSPLTGLPDFTGNSKLPVLHPWYEKHFSRQAQSLGRRPPTPLTGSYLCLSRAL